jgi:hypothetical protein
VILPENMEADFEPGDSMVWRILRDKIKKPVLQSTEHSE